jgi:hypothetical protein
MKVAAIILSTILVCITLASALVQFTLENSEAMKAYLFSAAISVILLLITIIYIPEKNENTV